MKTIEEQKIEAVFNLLDYFGLCLEVNHEPRALSEGELKFISEKILNALKQFEQKPLKVNLRKILPNLCRVSLPNWFNSEQEALEFCKKYNLKVVG